MWLLRILFGIIAFVLLYDTTGNKKKKSRNAIRRSKRYNNITYRSKQYNNRAYRNKQVKKLCSPEKEKEMEMLGLEEWQKDLVREGRFEPWSFKSKASGDVSEGSYYKDDTW